MFRLYINNKSYAFNNDSLINFVKYFITNEKANEDEPKWCICFSSNSIVKKSHEDLQLHEFILEGNFRISVLLCHVENIFGREVAIAYANYLNEKWDSENYVESISTLQALSIARKVFNTNEDYSKFIALLGTIFAFNVVKFDFQQSLTDEQSFNKYVYVNGNVFVKRKHQESLLLEPIFTCYKVDCKEYINVDGIFIPPLLFKSVLNTYYTDDMEYVVSDDIKDLFLLKLKQLLGTLPTPLIETKKWKHEDLDHCLFGRWYRIVNESMGSLGSRVNTYEIEEYLSSGILRRSRIMYFAKGEWRENFPDITWDWFTKNNVLYVADKCLNTVYEKNYHVDGNILYINGEKYYRNVEEVIPYSK